MSDETITVLDYERFYQEPMVLDNGSEKVRFNIRDACHTLDRLLGKVPTCKLLDQVLGFKTQVEAGKNRLNADGQPEPWHIGSSDLMISIESEFYCSGTDGKPAGTTDPSKWGLQTENEVKLAAKLISTFATRE